MATNERTASESCSASSLNRVRQVERQLQAVDAQHALYAERGRANQHCWHSTMMPFIR
jgi:hypothetical protein